MTDQTTTNGRHHLPAALSFTQEAKLLESLRAADRIAHLSALVVAERVSGALAGDAPHLDPEAWAAIEKALAAASWPPAEVARWRERIEHPLEAPRGELLLAALVDLAFQVGWERCEAAAREAIKGT